MARSDKKIGQKNSKTFSILLFVVVFLSFFLSFFFHFDFFDFHQHSFFSSNMTLLSNRTYRTPSSSLVSSLIILLLVNQIVVAQSESSIPSISCFFLTRPHTLSLSYS